MLDTGQSQLGGTPACRQAIVAVANDEARADAGSRGFRLICGEDHGSIANVECQEFPENGTGLKWAKFRLI